MSQTGGESYQIFNHAELASPPPALLGSTTYLLRVIGRLLELQIQREEGAYSVVRAYLLTLPLLPALELVLVLGLELLSY